MLAVDLTQVADEESILVTGVTDLMINVGNALAKGIANQLLGEHRAALWWRVDIMFSFYKRMVGNRWDILFKYDCCHYHIPGVGRGYNCIN